MRDHPVAVFRWSDSHYRDSVMCLVEENRGLISFVIRRYFSGVVYDRFERADFEAVALQALMVAVTKYDPLRGFRFSTFAVRCMFRALQGFLKQSSWGVPPDGSVFLSLDAPVPGAGVDAAVLADNLADTSLMPVDSQVFDRADLAAIWTCAEAVLDVRSLRIFRLVYGDGFTLSEASRIVGVGRIRVTQLHQQAISTVRERLALFRAE